MLFRSAKEEYKDSVRRREYAKIMNVLDQPELRNKLVRRAPDGGRSAAAKHYVRHGRLPGETGTVTLGD